MKDNEVEIASSTEHLHKDTFDSLVNHTKIIVCFQVARWSMAHTHLTSCSLDSVQQVKRRKRTGNMSFKNFFALHNA